MLFTSSTYFSLSRASVAASDRDRLMVLKSLIIDDRHVVGRPPRILL